MPMLPALDLPDLAAEPQHPLRRELIERGDLRPARTSLRRVRLRPGQRLLELDADGRQIAAARIRRARSGEAAPPTHVPPRALRELIDGPEVQTRPGTRRQRLELRSVQGAHAVDLALREVARERGR